MNEQYPRGKFNNDDEGATKVAISTQDKTVLINFFKPIIWIGLDKHTALNMAKILIEHADKIVDETVQ